MILNYTCLFRQIVCIAIILFLNLQILKAHTLKLSEIMYNPNDDASRNEFLELYNSSETDTIDLQGYTIEGTTSSFIAITELNDGSMALLPQRFAIVLPESYFEESHTQLYNASIPTDALILKASKNLSLNNSSDHILIKDSAGNSVIDFTYPGGGEKGYSLEKILFTKDDLEENYAPSLTENGTPGFRNSVAPFLYDLAIFAPSELHAPPNTTAEIPAKIKNKGLTSFGNGAKISLYLDQNTDSLPDANELISSVNLSQSLSPEDSTEITFYFTPASLNPSTLILTISHPEDENLENNLCIFKLFIGAKPRSIAINEILYAPIQDADDFMQDQPDFIELYNRSHDAIDLNGWYILDAPNEHGEQNIYTITSESSALLEPGGYAVFSPEKNTHPDSSRLVLYYTYLKSTSALHLYDHSRSTFSLNNEGDQVILKDSFGYTVDSVNYSPGWHNPFYTETSGKSLERLNPDLASNDAGNWSTSTDREYGGSPGKQNQVFVQTGAPTETAKLQITPNPFSPNADGHDDHTVISFTLTETVNRIQAKIFNARGRLIQTLENGLPTGNSGTVIWDGHEKSGKIAPIGIYIVLVEAFSATGKSTVLKKPVVLAQPLN